eukprot:maker-scaffold832_size90819-snap-gene-0.13 protein:Tk09605 transcript:maker-scaffold832_size90819-snap-gene-0.13-mRNA-1 annotation:"proto-oncogene c-fos"
MKHGVPLHPSNSYWIMNDHQHNPGDLYDTAGGSGPQLDVHLAVPGGCPTGDGSHTPNTPEILNSIFSMQQGPFAGYGHHQGIPEPATSTGVGGEILVPMLCGLQPEENSLTLLRSMSPQGEALSPASELPGPSSSVGSTPCSNISVQHYRSQFIKEGLKMKVQQKLGAGRGRHTSEESLASTSVCSPMDPATPGGSESIHIKSEELTEEDEVRRQRRRERNKVAATKCRNKKKHRTQLLVKESEVLEDQNKYLKTEISRLEGEKKRLMGVLSIHEPSCAKRQRSNQETHTHPRGSEDLHLPAFSATSGFQDFPDSIPTSPSFLPGLSSAPSNAYYQNNSSSQSLAYSEIKSEDQSGHDYLRVSCGSNYSAINPSTSTNGSGSFLVKRPIPASYLDMDSRCIAL